MRSRQAGTFDFDHGRVSAATVCRATVERDRAGAAGEGDGLADPVAGVGAGEDRIFEDRVEAVLDIVIGVAVAAREQAGAADAGSS